MQRAIAIAAAIVLSVCPLYAEFVVTNQGTWPVTWPKELEGLRKQAKTYEGPQVLLRRYAIPFTSREEFEAAWPQILAVKSKGAPIILIPVRGRTNDFFRVLPAGVMIQTPPVSEEPEVRGQAAKPIPGDRSVRSKWQNATFIELVVDGEIVDLNRIPFPPDAPIVDERFQDGITDQ